MREIFFANLLVAFNLDLADLSSPSSFLFSVSWNKERKGKGKERERERDGKKGSGRKEKEE